MRRLMACSHSRDDPASRFRVVQYLPFFTAAGWDVTHRPNRPSRYWTPRWPLRSLQRRAAVALRRASRERDVRDAARCDAVFVNRDLQEGRLEWEQRLFAVNQRVVFDFDDAIYLGPERRAHVGWVCAAAAWVTAGNESLAAFAREFTDRVTVVPSTVPVESYELHPLCRGAEPPGPARVGWLGSDLSIRETLYPHWEMLGRLQSRLGFEFVICSRPRPTPPPGGPRWRHVAWSPETEARISRHVDVGIMPLVDDEFQRGKCGMKLLQYMAAGLPVVASPVGVNAGLVTPGIDGFLATTETEWGEALAMLAASPDRRRALGLAGRDRCVAGFSTAAWAPRLLEILDRAAGVAPGRPISPGGPNRSPAAEP